MNNLEILSKQELIEIDGGVHGEDGGCIIGLPFQIGKPTY